ncbi:MAG: glycosyltransferase [Candidatus Omnitrophica bacterium]|nr:glycosyltransferase [Candidatus Omnitrophota bacterium]
MRVATLSGLSHESGGLYYSVSSLCKAVLKQNAGISVFGPLNACDHDALSIWNPVPVFAYRTYGPLRSSNKLRHLLRKQDPDLIHQHGIWLDDQWAALQWQKRTKRPVVISPRGMLDPWAVRNSAWKKKLAGTLFANESLQKANCIHALCESEAESIRAYGLNNPIAIIPNGVELPELDRSAIKAKRKKGKRTLLFLGRIHPKKGLSELFTAWSRIQAQKPGALTEWELIIAGWDDGGHLEGLKKLAAELGLSNGCCIQFAGPKFGDEKDNLLKEGDAFILPSFSEGLPMSVLEAWSYGLPVLMTEHCNLPIGFKFEAAIRIEPSSASIGQGLEQLFTMTDEQLVAMGSNGRKLVESQFQWDKIAQKMISAYAWCLGGNRPDCII